MTWKMGWAAVYMRNNNKKSTIWDFFLITIIYFYNSNIIIIKCVYIYLHVHCIESKKKENELYMLGTENTHCTMYMWEFHISF